MGGGVNMTFMETSQYVFSPTFVDQSATTSYASVGLDPEVAARMAAELGSQAWAAVFAEHQRVVQIEMQAQHALAEERAKLFKQEVNARNMAEVASR